MAGRARVHARALRGRGEVARTRFALHSIAAAAILWAVALVRFRDSVRWDAAGTVAMIALAVLLVTAIGAARPGRAGSTF